MLRSVAEASEGDRVRRAKERATRDGELNGAVARAKRERRRHLSRQGLLACCGWDWARGGQAWATVALLSGSSW